MNILSKQVSKIKYFTSCDASSISYKNYLKRQKIQTIFGSKLILVESDQSSGNVLGLSLFLPVLAKHLDSRISYFAMMKSNRRGILKQYLRNYFSVNRHIGIRETLIIQEKNLKLHEYFLKITDISTPEELEKFTIDGVRIGDLIYDTYLRRTSQPTVDLDSYDFRAIFRECVGYFLNFQELFSSKEISAVCVSHCVYHFAIPARIAFSLGIPVFQVTGETIYKMDSKKTHAYTEFTHFRQEFSLLSAAEQTNGIELAKARLDQRFSGQIAVDMPYSTKSAFSDENQKEELRFPNDGKIRVLIATHDFFDSPHSYGDNFYPDFYIWLEKLGEISNETDYNWYFKTHRDSVADDRPFISDLVRKFPKFIEIDSHTSHHTIIDAGIDFVLTVFGTVGMEYTALGIPVINASRNNPHVNYDFCITPNNATDFENVIRNLPSVIYGINNAEIYEYYYMAHLFNPKSWIYYDYDKYLQNIGGYLKSVSSAVYTEYQRGGDNHRPLSEINLALENFLDSGDFHVSRHHFE
jgi:hypothetical protein